MYCGIWTILILAGDMETFSATPVKKIKDAGEWQCEMPFKMQIKPYTYLIPSFISGNVH